MQPFLLVFAMLTESEYGVPEGLVIDGCRRLAQLFAALPTQFYSLFLYCSDWFSRVAG